MEGRIDPATLRIKGSIKGREFVALVDGGSTHNFLHPMVAKFLGLTITPAQQLTVTVGNDNKLSCEGRCFNVPLILGQHQFNVDFHLIPFHGSDVILRVQWLRKLDPTVFDYNQLYMSFNYGPERVTLTGLREETAALSRLHSFLMRSIREALATSIN